MPGDFKLVEHRQPPLKDRSDEWPARVTCYACHSRKPADFRAS
jgi:hypothetical protein